MGLVNVVGIIGMSCILSAFLLVQVGYFTPKSLCYELLNFVGSVFLVIYAIPPLSWPFIILNSIWALASLWEMIRRILPGKKV